MSKTEKDAKAQKNVNVAKQSKRIKKIVSENGLGGVSEVTMPNLLLAVNDENIDVVITSIDLEGTATVAGFEK